MNVNRIRTAVIPQFRIICMNRGLIYRIFHALTGRSFTVVQIDAESFLNIKSRQELADYLSIELRELTFFAYSNSSFYRHFYIPKGDGSSRRIISAPKGKLATVQRTLAATLGEIYQPPYPVNGFVKGKSTVTNALPHVRARGILKLDINDFFPSITASRIHGLFSSEPFCFSTEVVDTLTNLTCCNQTLPQGAPTSPVLSNMICYRMDKTLLNLARKHKLRFTRYADDLTFSSTSRRAISSIASTDERGEVVISEEIARIVQHNGFSITSRKTTYMGSETRQTVTGIVVNEKCNFRRDDYRYLRNLFYRWKNQGVEVAAFSYAQHLKMPSRRRSFVNESGEFSEDLFRQHIRGILSYYSMIVSNNERPSEPLQKLWTSYHDLTMENVPEMIPERSIYQIETTYDYESSESKEGLFAVTGTAFMLDNAGLVTARHCILPSLCKRPIFRQDPLMEVVAGKHRIERDIKDAVNNGIDDWAIIPDFQVEHNQPALSIAASNDLQQGMKVIAYGFAEGERVLRKIQARITEVLEHEAIVDRAFIQGMSGGPVLNARGKVIGVITQGSGSGLYDRDGRFLSISSILEGYRSIRPLNNNEPN